MPVSRTAQRMPVVRASNKRPAASAFTVSLDRQTLALARRFRLTLHINPGPSATVGRPSNKAAKAWISSLVGAGSVPTSWPAALPVRSSSIAPPMRMSFCSRRGSELSTREPGLNVAEIGGELLQRGAGPGRVHRRHRALPPGAERQRRTEQLRERQRREDDRLVVEDTGGRLCRGGGWFVRQPLAQRARERGRVGLVVRRQQQLDRRRRTPAVLDPDVGKDGEVLREAALVLGFAVEQSLDRVALHVRRSLDEGDCGCQWLLSGVRDPVRGPRTRGPAESFEAAGLKGAQPAGRCFFT